MKVIIKQHHCLNTYFLDCKDCGLSRAIREQHPNFKLDGVGGGYIRDKDTSKQYFFNNSYGTGWETFKFYELQKGEISEYILDIPVPEYDNAQSKTKDIDTGSKRETPEPEKIKTKYVTVKIDNSILTEAKEETVLS